MKKLVYLILGCAALLVAGQLYAQNPENPEKQEAPATSEATETLEQQDAPAPKEEIGISVRNQKNPVRHSFSNVAVSVHAGLGGYGFAVATPLSKHFTVRAGYSYFPLGYKYTYSDFDFESMIPSSVPSAIRDDIANRLDDIEIDLKAKLQMNSAHLLVDYAPFKQGTCAFFITAGLYFGSGKLVTVTGAFDEATKNKVNGVLAQYSGTPGVPKNIDDLQVEIGDVNVKPINGEVTADLKVKSIKPYVGLGFGRAIPYRRVGFRFELGAMFHGKPEIVSPNGNLSESDDLSDVNKFLKNFKIYPQMNFNVTVRLLKDKK